MKKIPTLFVRDHSTKFVTDEVNPDCFWVLGGEGVATRKRDGTCCMVRAGVLYKRYEARFRLAAPLSGRPGDLAGYVPLGKLPPGFEPADGIDPVTLKQQGWVPVGAGPEDRWHVEAAGAVEQKTVNVLSPHGDYPPGILCLPDGTYELCGPKVQGNPEGLDRHALIRHGSEPLPGAPRDFASIRDYLATFRGMEGIVWHHPDGRMAKVKARDFGPPDARRGGPRA